MEKTNREGLTWAEWAYAAGVPEPVYQLGVGFDNDVVRFSPNTKGYSAHFRKERKAWRAGEDPTEHLAARTRKE